MKKAFWFSFHVKMLQEMSKFVNDETSLFCPFFIKRHIDPTTYLATKIRFNGRISKLDYIH
jgi:hypothetical protein